EILPMQFAIKVGLAKEGCFLITVKLAVAAGRRDIPATLAVRNPLLHADGTEIGNQGHFVGRGLSELQFSLDIRCWDFDGTRRNAILELLVRGLPTRRLDVVVQNLIARRQVGLCLSSRSRLANRGEETEKYRKDESSHRNKLLEIR